MLAKRLDCALTATDVNSDYVARARANAARNGVRIEVVESDLFDHVPGAFDVICWDPVYVPRRLGLKLGFDRMHERASDWCGGETGLEEIARFLAQARDHLTSSGRVVLGLNRLYVSSDAVADTFKRNGFAVAARLSQFWNPSHAFALRQAP